jgi:hypothetical protein
MPDHVRHDGEKTNLEVIQDYFCFKPAGHAFGGVTPQNYENSLDQRVDSNPIFALNPHASLRHRRSMKMLNFYFEYLSFLTKEEGRFLYGG